MTSGDGIAHSEESSGNDEPILHGVQLWVALPEPARRDATRAFEQHTDLPVVALPGATVTVLVGTVAGARSPAYSFTPLLGAEIGIEPGAAPSVPLQPHHEYAVLVVDGPVTVAGEVLDRGQMVYVGNGRDQLALSTTGPGRVMLFGGEPFEERLVMWWNFVARSHQEIVQAREQWMAGLAAGRDDRFGVVRGFAGDPLPAPEMPTVQLRARGRSREV